jgi:hypothetical protein
MTAGPGPVRIAMWSGPRNLSTAMMRSFGNRPDTARVMDEPFYAAYLAVTGLDHPMRDAILASQPRDWSAVARACSEAPAPPGAIVYQKHMTHHMLPGIDLDWMDGLAHVFLIRDPSRVLASYVAKREAATLDDIGFTQQLRLFEHVADRTGETPPVIDAEDVRADPEKTLRGLCAAIGIPFELGMLSWPAGPRPEDGVWATHWYASVNASTGFAPPEPPPAELPPALRAIADAARPAYERMRAHRLV